MQRAIGHAKRGNWKSREWKIGQEWEWELDKSCRGRDNSGLPVIFINRARET